MLGMSSRNTIKRAARVRRDVPPVGQGVRSEWTRVRRDVPVAPGGRMLDWDLNRAFTGPTRLTIKNTSQEAARGSRVVLDLSFSGEAEPAYDFDFTQVWAYDFGAKTPEGILLVGQNERRMGIELHGDLFTLGSARHEFFTGDRPALGYHPVSPDMSPTALGVAVATLADLSDPDRWVTYRGWIEEAMIRISAVAQAIPARRAEPSFGSVAPQNVLNIRTAEGRRGWSAAAVRAVTEARVALDEVVRAYFMVDVRVGDEED